MTNFIKGKIHTIPEKESSQLTIEFEKAETTSSTKGAKMREFSEEATAVFNAGRELWRYYHSQENANVNASLYDIREHFQGRNDKGKMNSRSDDTTYTELISKLRNQLSLLADKISPKIYEYGFLKK